MSDSKAYGYAVARIRAMEPLLLDSSAYQRMLDADGAAGALKVLAETTYGKELTADAASGRYDAALETELLSTFEEFATFVPSRALIDIFRVPYDFHNVKVVLKSMINARAGGRKRWDLMTKLGTINTEKLAVAIESEDYSFLPFGLQSVIPSCLATYEQEHDIVAMERVLDRAMYAVLLKLAASTEVPGAVAWIRSRIDAENIRGLLRLKRFGFDSADASQFMYDGGTITMMDLMSILPEPFENWARMLPSLGIGGVLAQVQDEGAFDKLIIDVEKALDDWCASLLEKARYSASAPENVLAYLYGKEQEMKNIRTVLVSKSTDQPQEETRRLMRHGY